MTDALLDPSVEDLESSLAWRWTGTGFALELPQVRIGLGPVVVVGVLGLLLVVPGLAILLMPTMSGELFAAIVVVGMMLLGLAVTFTEAVTNPLGHLPRGERRMRPVRLEVRGWDLHVGRRVLPLASIEGVRQRGGILEVVHLDGSWQSREVPADLPSEAMELVVGRLKEAVARAREQQHHHVEEEARARVATQRLRQVRDESTPRSP